MASAGSGLMPDELRAAVVLFAAPHAGWEGASR